MSEEALEAMLLTKIKIATVVVLMIAAVGGAAGPIYQTSGAEEPKAKEKQPSADKDQKKGEEKQEARREDQPLRALIDKLLAAHGGEEKLRKLNKFTETVWWMRNEDELTGTNDRYFVQPPDRFREEWVRGLDLRQETHVAILKKDGMKVWINRNLGEGFERAEDGFQPLEYYLDDVKFFGPRRVLRLKDADHRVALLDEAKINGRPAVGVELTKAVPNFKLSLQMFFDKETNLLAKQENVLSSTSIFYTDYKKFDGFPIARKETAESAKDKTYTETKVIEFRVVEKSDAKLFEQP
jgi:hypothetical protein